MNTIDHDPVLSALRTLDPEPVHPASPPVEQEVEALEAILRTPRTHHERARHPRRVLVLAGAAAAAAVGLLVLPQLRPERSGMAWSATPTRLSALTASDGATACRAAQLAQAAREEGPSRGRLTAQDIGTARLVLAEGRGRMQLVLLATTTGRALTCTSVDAPDGDFTSSMGPFTTPTATGVSVSGEGASAHGEGFLLVYGRVGEEVTAVDLETQAGTVHASVSDGWMGAWWPMSDVGTPTSPFTPVTVTVTTRHGGRQAPVPYDSLPGVLPGHTGA